MAALLLFSCVISALKGVSEASLQPHNLTFMMIASFGQYGFNSSGALPAVDMALEDINSNPDVLPGYNLMYDKVRDSMVSQPGSYKCVCALLLRCATRRLFSAIDNIIFVSGVS